MNFYESLGVALFCIGGVFVVLAALCVILKLFTFLLNGFSKQPIADPMPGPVVPQPPVPEAAPADSGLILEGVDEPTAAVIMAVVSHESGIDLSELRFKSIKLLNR